MHQHLLPSFPEKRSPFEYRYMVVFFANIIVNPNQIQDQVGGM